jgi:hypothetical protein
MFKKSPSLSVLMATSFLTAGILPAAAELPGLTEKKWLGYFIGYADRRCEFGFTVKGKSALKVVGAKGLPLPPKQAIQLEFLVEETSANGKISLNSLLPESLESTQPADKKPKDVVIRGQTKNGSRCELSFNEDHGEITVSGRVLGQETVVENGPRFLIQVTVPDVYPSAKKDPDPSQKKVFQDKIKNDQMILIRADGTRTKRIPRQMVQPLAKEYQNLEVSAVEMEFSPYADKKLRCHASVNSAITLSQKRELPLYRGFILTWRADLTKDPKGRAQLKFSVR